MPTLGELQRQTGLKASDRTEEEKKALNTYTGTNTLAQNTVPTKLDKDTLSKINFKKAAGVKDTKDKVQGINTSFVHPNIGKHEADFLNAYKENLAGFKEQYGLNRNSVNESAIDHIISIAEKNSSYFKKFRNTDKLPLSNDDYKRLAANYDTNKEAYGEDYANRWLDNQFKDIVGSNQSWYE